MVSLFGLQIPISLALFIMWSWRSLISLYILNDLRDNAVFLAWISSNAIIYTLSFSPIIVITISGLYLFKLSSKPANMPEVLIPPAPLFITLNLIPISC